MSTASKTVRNAVDTWVEQDHPGKRRPRGTQLRVQNGEAITLLYLPNPVPRGAKVTSAELRLYTAGSFGGASPQVDVQRIGERYSNSKATWTNKPSGTGATVSSSHASTGDGDLWTWNVASLMQAVADGAAWFGFRITTTSATARTFRSAQARGKQPTLVISWTEAPDAPTTLSPSGGQAVNAAKPVVEGDYTDTSGTTTLAGMQVQVSASPTMSAPWDSGEVLASGSKARLDLAGTTYPGLAEGGVAYWRMRVQDSSGEWSEWSEVASWSRTAKGVVTIDSPSAGSPTLTDFTPTALWSFSKPQEKWQVLVRRTDTDEEVFDSGESATIDGAVVIEDADGDAVLALGVPYEIEVRAWDDADRIGTTDDPPYSVATRAFTIAAGATAGVTGLRFEPTEPLPGLTVVFERAAAPDAFTITRDGVPVATNVSPDDFERDGLTFRFPLSNVRPNVDNVIGVAAIENGIASPVVEATGRAKVSGVWLVDKDLSRTLLVAKTGSSKFEQGEDGETVVPLGATQGVRITQGLRGYEGSVEGVLATIGGKTRDEWVDNLLAMREETGKVRRLVVGTEVFDVVTWNMQVRPTGDSAPGMRPCSFEFMQVGARRKVV